MKTTTFLTGLLALVISFSLMMLSVRLLLTPAFLAVEYRMPGFPQDPYGFTLQNRVAWASLTMNYLTDKTDSLSSFTLSTGAPLYNDRELAHLDDVKKIVQPLLLCWHIILIALFFLGIFSWYKGWMNYYVKAGKYGGWLSLITILIIAVSSFFAFDQLFSQFHILLFAEESWLFYASDTLMRLFPERFWQDCVLYIAALTGMSDLTLRSLLKNSS